MDLLLDVAKCVGGAAFDRVLLARMLHDDFERPGGDGRATAHALLAEFPGGQLGGIRFAADGGQMGFPRRNGGIDPSEGSGTKDDVPAMLMAGEFVLTKDAVKGLGNGDSNRGIEKAYSMMKLCISFERFQ